MLRVVSASLVLLVLLLAAIGSPRPAGPGVASAAAPPNPAAQTPGAPAPQGQTPSAPQGQTPSAPQGQVPPAPQGQAPPAPGARGASAATADSFAADRDSLMNEVLKSIAGRENVPAESVFKNIKNMKGVPAGRLPRIMNMGFGRSLGVGCAHCHVVGHWADEDKPQKEIARQMMEMSGTINKELLPRIRGLKSEAPAVNCTTCHRGARKPALNL